MPGPRARPQILGELLGLARFFESGEGKGGEAEPPQPGQQHPDAGRVHFLEAERLIERDDHVALRIGDHVRAADQGTALREARRHRHTLGQQNAGDATAAQ